jgi:hypothetical protein
LALAISLSPLASACDDRINNPTHFRLALKLNGVMTVVAKQGDASHVLIGRDMPALQCVRESESVVEHAAGQLKLARRYAHADELALKLSSDFLPLARAPTGAAYRSLAV